MIDLPLIKYKPDLESTIVQYNENDAPVEGRQILLNKIVKLFMTRQGSLVWDTQWGNSFYDLITQPSAGNDEVVKQTIPLMIKSLEDIILEQQQGETLDDEERLVSLTLDNLVWDDILKSWHIQLNVLTADNSQTTARIP